MKINEFQEECLRTINNSGKALIIECALGITGEAGEVADDVKKWQGQGHWLNEEHIIEELGDVAYYIAVMAAALNTNLETVLKRNVEKRKKRYPNGFESERSINR